MADPTQLLYLEPDDEITSVVRRLREADAGRVVLVASGRSKAIASAIALRLLAGVAAEDGREIALVADPSGRALAAEAGIPAFASVNDASAEGATPVEAPAPRRAPIRVVRGEAAVEPIVAVPAVGPTDETQAVPVAAPPPRPSAPPAASRRLMARHRRLPRAALGALVALLLLAAGALAAVAPAATIIIAPRSAAIDPVSYTLILPAAGADEGELSAEADGTATGAFSNPSAATGTVTFLNWTYVTVEVPSGTPVSAGGEVFFLTTERVIAPAGSLFGFEIRPGQVSVGVVADAAGPAGNVAAAAIDTVENRTVDGYLRGFPTQSGRRVTNPEPTSGGSENRQPEVVQADVDAVLEVIGGDLAEQLEERLADDPGRLYAPVDAGDPVIEVPEDLVGLRGEETFTLAGTLAYHRAYVERDAVDDAARARLLGDRGAVPEGREILADTISVEVVAVDSDGEGLRVEVTVRAEAVPAFDLDSIRALVAGRPAAEAAELLSPLGDVSIELWPGWVTAVPQLEWRVDVRVEGEPIPSASPVGSGNAQP